MKHTVVLSRIESWLRITYKFLVWVPFAWIILFLILILRVKLTNTTFHFQDDAQLPRDAQILGELSFFGFFLTVYSTYAALPLTLYFLLRKQGPALKRYILVLLLGVISCICLMYSAWFEWLLD